MRAGEGSEGSRGRARRWGPGRVTSGHRHRVRTLLAVCPLPRPPGSSGTSGPTQSGNGTVVDPHDSRPDKARLSGAACTGLGTPGRQDTCDPQERGQPQGPPSRRAAGPGRSPAPHGCGAPGHPLPFGPAREAGGGGSPAVPVPSLLDPHWRSHGAPNRDRPLPSPATESPPPAPLGPACEGSRSSGLRERDPGLSLGPLGPSQAPRQGVPGAR